MTGAKGAANLNQKEISQFKRGTAENLRKHNISERAKREQYVRRMNDRPNSRVECGYDKQSVPTIHTSNFDRILIFEKFGCAINMLFSKTV